MSFVVKMLMIRLVLIVGFTLFQSGCGWNTMRPPVKHAPDLVDEFKSYRDTADTVEVELYNQATLEKRKFDAPVMKAMPHANAGLLGDSMLSGDGAAKQSSAIESVKTPAKQVEFDFKDIDLRDLVALFFDEYLKKPYTILDDFKDKKVNFVFHGEVSHAELLKIFEVFLNYQGAAIKFNQGVYAITATTNTTLTLPAAGGVGDTSGIFKLRYISAQEFHAAASLLLADKGMASAKVLDDFNTVYVKASQAEVAAVKQLQQSLDVPYFTGKYLLVYGPSFLKVAAAKALIDKYEHTLGSKTAHPKRRLEVDTVLEESRLVIVAADKEARDLVVQFLESVDKPGRSERQMFQYPLSSQVATEVLSTVEGLLKAATKNSEPIEVVADKLTNSLFFMATAEEFAEITKLLNKLDFPVPAVHIDCVVAEVNLDDTLGYGVEWYLDQVARGTVNSGTLNMLSNAGAVATAATTGGLSLAAVGLNNNKYVTLNLLAANTNLKLLSNPHLLVKNGATASVSVGQNIGVPASKTALSSASIVGAATTQTNYTREDVTLKLEITPKISMQGVIQLSVTLGEKTITTLSDVNGNPIFSKRDFKTDLVIEDSQTVLLGGVIQRSKSNAIDKVPWLGDIPYLGTFFSNLNQEDITTELFMLITPRLVLDAEGAQLVSKALMDSSRKLLKQNVH